MNWEFMTVIVSPASPPVRMPSCLPVKVLFHQGGAWTGILIPDAGAVAAKRIVYLRAGEGEAAHRQARHRENDPLLEGSPALFQAQDRAIDDFTSKENQATAVCRQRIKMSG